MKTNRILTFLSVIALTFFVASCVEDDDFSTPDVTIVEPDLAALGFTNPTTFAAVVSRYEDAVADGDQVGTFDTENDIGQYITGYVVSSDQSGNFFEEIIIQNTPDETDPAGNDPRRGFNVEINVRSLSDTYEVGRKVYIKMNGLAIGEEHGVFTIGRANGSNLEQLQEFEYTDFIVRSSEVATITPKVTTVGDLTEMDENTFIQLDNMQVHRNEVILTYAGEASDQFDGFRTLEDCVNGGSISLQTSTFADFKSLPLPQNKGSIKAIFTRDFGDDANVLVVNGTSDITFDDTDRCDPLVLECTTPSGGGSDIFSENFESFSDYVSEGWTNINISGTSTDWFISSFGGNTYSRISAFNSNNTDADVWLVTPSIDLDSTTGEELSFDVQSNFDNGTILSVFISTDFTGDPTTATWQQLDATIPIGPGGGFGNFETVGPINISCLDGSVNVGFLYEGSDPSATTRYHVDNVEVTGN
jgi:hypothetical protein